MRRAGLALGVVLLAWLPMLVGCGDGGDDSADPRSPETASGEFAGTIRLGAALSETGKYDPMFERGFQNLFLVATIASDYTRSGALGHRGRVQVLDGEIVVVAPDDAATAQLQYPWA